MSAEYKADMMWLVIWLVGVCGFLWMCRRREGEVGEGGNIEHPTSNIQHREGICEWVDEVARGVLVTSCGTSVSRKAEDYGFKCCGFCGRPMRIKMDPRTDSAEMVASVTADMLGKMDERILHDIVAVVQDARERSLAEAMAPALAGESPVDLADEELARRTWSRLLPPGQVEEAVKSSMLAAQLAAGTIPFERVLGAMVTQYECGEAAGRAVLQKGEGEPRMTRNMRTGGASIERPTSNAERPEEVKDEGEDCMPVLAPRKCQLCPTEIFYDGLCADCRNKQQAESF